MHVLENLAWSLGGFVAGAGSVIIWAKATGQRLQWRRNPIVRALACEEKDAT